MGRHGGGLSILPVKKVCFACLVPLFFFFGVSRARCRFAQHVTEALYERQTRPHTKDFSYLLFRVASSSFFVPHSFPCSVLCLSWWLQPTSAGSDRKSFVGGWAVLVSADVRGGVWPKGIFLAQVHGLLRRRPPEVTNSSSRDQTASCCGNHRPTGPRG